MQRVAPLPADAQEFLLILGGEIPIRVWHSTTFSNDSSRHNERLKSPLQFGSVVTTSVVALSNKGRHYNW